MESRMLRLLESPDVLEELRIEIVSPILPPGKTCTYWLHLQSRSLLRSASLGTLRGVGALIRRLLSCMEPIPVLYDEGWGGKAFKLSQHNKNSQRLSVALLSTLSHRWLPTLR
jgi:hypothetical protein